MLNLYVDNRLSRTKGHMFPAYALEVVASGAVLARKRPHLDVESRAERFGG